MKTCAGSYDAHTWHNFPRLIAHSLSDCRTYCSDMDLKSKSMSKHFAPAKLADTYEIYEREKCDISVVGSLKRHAKFWQILEAPPNILEIVNKGYSNPLLSLPPTKYLKNNKSSLENAEFVRRSIDDLLRKGAIQELKNPPRVVNPLTVAQKDDKRRLVLDCRFINKYVHKQKCKIEGTETFVKYLAKATHLFGFDLKAGYHHVDVVPAQWSLLGFAFMDHKGNTRHFCFKVLPFGLTSAGFVFTKVLRVLIRFWRSRGIQICTFFDDGMAACFSYEEAFEHSCLVRYMLLQAGFIPNAIKSNWVPCSQLWWLGFYYDLLNRYISASPKKLENLIELIETALQSRALPVRTLAKITGSLISLHLAFGDIVFLKSKRCQKVIADGEDWNRFVKPDEHAKDELKFWLSYLIPNNGMPILTPIAAAAISYSDASGVGVASLITPCPQQETITVHRELSLQESEKSSTYRELVAVYHGLEQTKHLLKNHPSYVLDMQGR